MINGALDRSFEGIEHVRFINGTYSKGLDPAVMYSEEGSTVGEGGLTGWAISLIVIAVFAVVAFAALFVAQRKKKRECAERKELSNRMISIHLDELERDSVGERADLHVPVE